MPPLTGAQLTGDEQPTTWTHAIDTHSNWKLLSHLKRKPQNQNELLKASFPEVLEYNTIIARMKEYSNYGILIMVLLSVVVDTVALFYTAFLLHKATEVSLPHDKAPKWNI